MLFEIIELIKKPKTTKIPQSFVKIIRKDETESNLNDLVCCPMYIKINNIINKVYSFVTFLRNKERIGNTEKINVEVNGSLINLVHIKNLLKRKLHKIESDVITTAVANFQDLKHK